MPMRSTPFNRRIRISTQNRAVALYERGSSSREVAIELDIGRSTVLKILRMRAVDVRPRGNTPSQRKVQTTTSD